MIGGMFVIGALYMLVNAAVQYALPPAQVANSASPMADAIKNSFLGRPAWSWFPAPMVISLMATLNGVAMSGARMTFAMARDGNFFQGLAKVHPRFHTPHVAIVVQAILTLVFLLIRGNFRQLFTLALFAEWLSYMAVLHCTVCVAKTSSATAQKYRFGVFTLAPALFIVASAALLYYTFISNLRYSAWGTLVILAGIPVFYGFALRRRV